MEDEFLIGMQSQFRQSRPLRPKAFGATVLVCLVLLALLAVVQVAHMHPLGSDADRCPLCIVMHSAAPVALLAAAVVLVKLGGPEPAFEAHAAVRYWQPKLFTRPPPAGC